MSYNDLTDLLHLGLEVGEVIAVVDTEEPIPVVLLQYAVGRVGSPDSQHIRQAVSLHRKPQ